MTKLGPLVPLLTFISATNAFAADIPTRQPVGSWVVDFDDAQCVASRSYGTRDNPLTLAVKAPPIGELMQVVLIRPVQGAPEPSSLNARVLVNGGAAIDASMVAFTTSETGQRLYRMNLPSPQFAAIAKANTVRIQGGSEVDEQLQLTQMGPLLKVLDNCTADLRQAWNIAEGGGASGKLRQRATGDPSAAFSTDYPSIEVGPTKGGATRVAVLVDEKGLIADCSIIETSGVAAFDAQSCWMMKGARFRPAIGADGNPARDAHMQQVVWEED